MKIETKTASSCQERVLLLFDQGDPSDADDSARSYLSDNGLDPKRIYQETRGAAEYEVYYFGSCVIGSHMANLEALAQKS